MMCEASQDFKPYFNFNNEHGILDAHFSEEPDYSESVSDNITLMRSLETKEITGCVITGIKTK